MIDELTEVLKTAMPGVLGATSAVVFTRGDWIKRTAMVFMSSAAAYYSYEYVASQIDFPSGLTSFVIGIFAAPFFDKVVEELYKAPLSKLLMRFATKILGLPHDGEIK